MVELGAAAGTGSAALATAASAARVAVGRRLAALDECVHRVPVDVRELLVGHWAALLVRVVVGARMRVHASRLEALVRRGAPLVALGGVLAGGEARDAVGLEVGRLLELGRHLRSEGDDGAVGAEEDAVVEGGVAPGLADALVAVGGELGLGLLLRVEGNVPVAVVVAVVEVEALVEAHSSAVPVGAIVDVLLGPVDVAVEGDEGVVRGAFDEELGDLRRRRRRRHQHALEAILRALEEHLADLGEAQSEAVFGRAVRREAIDVRRHAPQSAPHLHEGAVVGPGEAEHLHDRAHGELEDADGVRVGVDGRGRKAAQALVVLAVRGDALALRDEEREGGPPVSDEGALEKGFANSFGKNDAVLGGFALGVVGDHLDEEVLHDGFARDGLEALPEVVRCELAVHEEDSDGVLVPHQQLGDLDWRKKVEPRDRALKVDVLVVGLERELGLGRDVLLLVVVGVL